MASILRQIVAGPRAQHPEAGIDLCYVTDRIIATSGPSQSYPKRAYRTPLDRLVSFLDSKHGDNWAIWEFRAEGTGYPDEAVYGRIRHYPWPDHHPPPFRLLPMIVTGMRNWLDGGNLDGSMIEEQQQDGGAKGDGNKDEIKNQRVVVVHCKAGKGRSGTSAVSFLIAEEGWKPEDALARFTERRMRPKFGAGVSIPSQLRTVRYVDRWANAWKETATEEQLKLVAEDPAERRKRRHYIDRPVEILEVHAWNLRNGVKLEIGGYADEGKKIEVRHIFSKAERVVVEGDAPGGAGLADMVYDMAGYGLESQEEAPAEAELADATNAEGDATKTNDGTDDEGKKKKMIQKAKTQVRRRTTLIKRPDKNAKRNTAPEPTTSTSPNATPPETATTVINGTSDVVEPGGKAVIFKPESPILIPNSDVLVRMERRSRAPLSVGLAMVTATAHVWFNVFFEGNGPERMAEGKEAEKTGVFEIEWEAMDGLKGSSKKGTRAVDRIAVVWRAVGEKTEEEGTGADGKVPEMRAADWRGPDEETVQEAGQAGLGTVKMESDEDENGEKSAGENADKDKSSSESENGGGPSKKTDSTDKDKA